MSDAEKVSNRRSLGVMVAASAFLVWQVPLMDASERLVSEANVIVTAVSLSGFLVWILVLLWLISPWRLFTRDARLREALNDELTQLNRKRAFIVGYVAMLVCSGALLVLSLLVPVKGSEAAHLILVIGVVAPLYSFARLERT